MKKLPLDYIKTFGSTVGDTHFSKVTAMFNFDGSDGDTTTSGLDASNKNLSLTYSTGDELSTTQKKFGATSLYVADNVIVSSSDGFDMGTGDFTMEAWFYFTTFATSFALFDQWDSSGSTRNQVWHSTSTDGKLAWYYAGTSNFASANPAVSTGAWTHIALVRHSGTLKMYINGTAESNTASHSGQFGRSHTMYFGDQHGGGAGAPQYYMDDLRITKGLARYTANFTAPTTAHLTSAGDSLKNIIVNSDADGVIVGTSGINASRIAKAWVNFNGTGTVAIRSSYNISSITDQATGFYVANFSTAMSDTDYFVNVNSGWNTVTWGVPMFGTISGESTPFTTSKVGVVTNSPDDSDVDNAYVMIQVFGN